MSPHPVRPMDPAAFRRTLRRWYGGHHRSLPWRLTRDPYSIWVSEIMLQQTRVETAAGYFSRFLKAFPDVAALARASESRVLAAWSGLGYYSRARNLRRAAGILVREHASRFPRDFEAALTLPGIGRSTAGAILSIAFDDPHVVLDGNVARVLQRLHATGAGELGAKELWRCARKLLPPRSGGSHTQAMMELGATVCLARNPRCDECPVSRWCSALARGITAAVPAPRDRGKSVREEECAALAWRGRALVLERRLQQGALQGLVGLPLSPTPEGLLRRLGRGSTLGPELCSVSHSIMHRRISTRVWQVRMSGRARLGRGLISVQPATALDQPLDGTSRKILLREVGEGLRPG